MQFRKQINRSVASIVILLSVHGSAFASFLDTDFWCRTYGCAVVHDGQNVDIYDNYIFAQQRCCVQVGSPMVPYSTTFGSFNLTGSLDKAVPPTSGQGMMLGISQDGTTVSQSIADDGDGFIDAGDFLGGAFSLNPSTDIMLDGRGREYSHSFFISSRNTRMSLRALATIRSSTDDFANTISLQDIGLQTQVSNRGDDDGFRYGRRARANSRDVRVNTNIDDLGDLSATPTNLIDFRRRTGIRRNNGDINEQTIRLDFLYTMPVYDLSMGVGSLDIDMVFDLYREP